MPAITGTTRLIGILADPITHVRTPEVINQRFAAADIDAVMVPMHVGANGLVEAWQGLRQLRNLAGLVITVPHKAAVVALCDELLPNARRIGAVNAVHRLPDGRCIGEIFDGLGFVEGLRRQGRDPQGRRVLLFGAGGAASAIGFALAEAGVASLNIVNRSSAKARRLADQIAAAFPHLSVVVSDGEPAAHDLLVNATSLGLNPDDPLPLNPDWLKPGMTVAEVVMRPERTRLLEQAAARGCDTHEGLQMLQAQLDLLTRFVLEGR